MINSHAVGTKAVRNVKTQSVTVRECANTLVTLEEQNRVTLQ